YGRSSFTSTSGSSSRPASWVCNSSTPSPVCAETNTAPGIALRNCVRVTGSAASILLTTINSGGGGASDSRSTSVTTSRTALICSVGSGSDPSTTWSSTSASATSSRVDRNASTSWVGRCRTKPTVSVSTYSRPSGNADRRVVGS